MYNPDTQEVIDVDGREVRERKDAGFVAVGNRPESEYLGKTRDELLADEEPETEPEEGS